MKVLRSILIVGLLSMLTLSAALPINAAAGDLDTTFAGFGTGGKVIGPLGSSDSLRDTAGLHGMALQPDGKIVVAGERDMPVFGGQKIGLLVERYLANGTLDPTFGVGGLFTSYTFAPDQAHVTLQADGSILVAVQTFPFTSFILARLTPSGALDATFGNGGWVTTDFGGSHAVSTAILVQPDSKIVVAGFADGDLNDFAVARYNSDGTLDTSFDGDGKMTVDMGSDDRLSAIALQDDGKLVLAGSQFSDGNFAVARLNPNGSLDSSFDGDGKLTTGFGGSIYVQAIAIQPDGKIIVAGDNNSDGLVARYLPNGDLDSSFDGDGKLGISGLSGEFEDVKVQPDGKILLLGYHTSPDHSEKLAVYRRNANGAADLTFAGDGDALLDFGSGNAEGYALALQADGRITAFGQSGNHIALTRLWPDGSFDAGGTQLLGFDDPLLGPSTREGANAMATAPDGKIVVAGFVSDAANTDSKFALARFFPDGRLDTSFGSLGRVSYGFAGKQVATAVAIQSDGKIVAGGYTGSGSTANFMVARFNADGSADGQFGFGGFNVLDFMGGNDSAYALALAPDGKIVLAGTVFNGARNVFGVARFNTNGTLDQSFDIDGKQLIEVTANVTHAAKAVVVQPDGKIIVGGTVNRDFALVRLNEDGSLDGSFGSAGKTVTDMGGDDTLSALALSASGEIYAAGSRYLNTNNDFALAHYDTNGALACPPLRRCSVWTGGKAFVDFGGSDVAFALDVRDVDQIFAAGCSDGLFAWAQLKDTGSPLVAKGTTAFATGSACASGVNLVAPNKIVLAGTQIVGQDTNMALARFETTPHADTPISGLSATSSSPTLLGDTTTFTATIAGGTNVGYSWDFGDGASAIGANVTHTYAATGVFTASVVAFNNQGSVSAIVQVQVDAPPNPAETPTPTPVSQAPAKHLYIPLVQH